MKNNRWWIVASMSLALAWSALGQGAQETDRIELQRGSTRTLDFDSPIRSVDSDKVRVATVDILEGDRTIRIEAVEAGKAGVRIIFRDGTVRHCDVTVPDDLDVLLSYLRAQLRDILGLDPIVPTEDRKQVTVRGMIRISEQWKIYRNVMDKLKPEWKGMVNDLTVYRPLVNADPLKKILQGIPGLLSPNVEIGELDGMPAIRIIGKAFSELTQAQAQTSVEDELKKLKIDGVHITNDVKLERCDFDIELIYIEMRQDMAEKIGLDLLNGGLGLDLGFNVKRSKGQASWPWNVSGGFSYNKAEVLEFIKNNGGLETMSRQMVSIANGATAKATLGGTITLRPQPTDGTATTAAREVPYGFTLEVTPQLLDQRNIRLVVKDSGSTQSTEYKSGQDDVEVQGLQLSTTVTVEEGMQRTLNSVERRYIMHKRNGVPVLRDIPLIGSLFGKRSTEQLKQEAALIVVVRAKPVDGQPIFTPLTDITDAAIAEIKKRLEASSVTKQ